MSNSETLGSSVTEDDSAERYEAVRRVTLVGSAVDLVLGVSKLAVGWIASSQALIADGVHSLSDLATDVVVLVAAKHAHRQADADHPYGHARFETLATVALGVSLMVVAFGICYDAVHRMLNPERLLQPEWLALVVAGMSVAAKEAIYQYTMRVAERVKSSMLRANAWHSRSDALSSVAVIIGVAAAMFGYPAVDALAAVVVALMVARIGWRLAVSSVQELVDTGLDPEQVETLKAVILAVPGVEQLHMLRTRQMGGRVYADVHIILDNPRISVSEGHQISETVRAALIKNVDDVVDVTVHIDPEDDEQDAPNRLLPLRDALLSELEQHWRQLPVHEHIKQVRLHYLSGHVEVEVHLPLALAPSSADDDPHGLRAALVDLHHISRVQALYE